MQPIAGSAAQTAPARRSSPPSTPTRVLDRRAASRPQPQWPATAQSEADHAYYDLSFLKAPVWKWEIASYFFLGGLSGGAFALARLADRFGGKRFERVTRLGTAVSFFALLPCPLLLIHDLGDPARFHHMLRVFKPSSPMSLGTWTIVTFSGAAVSALVGDWAEAVGIRLPFHGLVRLSHDLVGIPMAFLLASYTGVLLSCTSNPLWSQSTWLGAMFSASAMASGTSAISLALQTAKHDEEDEQVTRTIDRLDTAAHVVEAACLAGYLAEKKELARPLTRGRMKKHLWMGLGGLLASELLKHAPLSGRAGRAAKVAGAVVGLASAFSLRWAIVHGGHESAHTPSAARRITGTSR